MTMKRIVLFSMGAAALALVGCAGDDKIDSTRSAQVVCEEARTGCEAQVDGAVGKLKELQDKCAADVQAACNVKEGAEPDAAACEAAASACNEQFEALAKSQADIGQSCADNIEASCKPDDQPAPGPQAPQPGAACSMAQDSCRSAIAGLHAKQESLHGVCGDAIAAACEKGDSAGCETAIKDCEIAVKAAQSEAEGIIGNCSLDIEKVCLAAPDQPSMPPAGQPSPPKPPQGPPSPGAPPAGPSPECATAQDSCGAGHDALAEQGQAVQKACSEAVAKGCGPDGKEEDCKAAHESCQAGHESLKTAFDANSAACKASVEKACVAPQAAPKP